MKINEENSNTTPEKKQMAIGNKSGLLCGLLALIIVILTAWIFISIRSTRDRLTEQSAQIETLITERDTLKAQKKEQKETAEANKPEKSRRETDLEAAKSFLSKLLTWDSAEKYRGIRDMLKETYQIPEENSLLTVFMPDLPDEALKGQNMEFAKAETYLVDDSTDAYQYFALCNVINNTEGATGYGRIGVFYSVDNEGTISGISAYTLVK